MYFLLIYYICAALICFYLAKIKREKHVYGLGVIMLGMSIFAIFGVAYGRMEIDSDGYAQIRKEVSENQAFAAIVADKFSDGRLTHEEVSDAHAELDDAKEKMEPAELTRQVARLKDELS